MTTTDSVTTELSDRSGWRLTYKEFMCQSGNFPVRIVPMKASINLPVFVTLGIFMVVEKSMSEEKAVDR